MDDSYLLIILTWGAKPIPPHYDMNHTNIRKGGLFFVVKYGGANNHFLIHKQVLFFYPPKRGQTRVINTDKVITATQLTLYREANLRVATTPPIVHYRDWRG